MIAVYVQNDSGFTAVPAREVISGWIKAALLGHRQDAEVAIRIVDEAGSAALNERYRDQRGPTNVLSFPAELPADSPVPHLGDLVICAAVVEREAREQNKRADAHWAHMVVHGLLHLLGHDHQEPRQAGEMEKLEAQILARLGYPDPYQEVS